MTPREMEIQNGLVDVLVKMLDPERIVLIGSRGKGINKETADFDIAVSGSKPDITTRQKLAERLDSILGLHKADIVYMDDVESDFKEVILATGKVLYEKRDSTGIGQAGKSAG